MSWLIVTISSYFLLAITALVDKYLLGGRIPSAKVYSFYVGTLGILVLFLIPFVGLSFPEPKQMILALSAGAFHILGLFIFYSALSKFEASRVAPAIGGFLPLFIFSLTYLIPEAKETPAFKEINAFILLISGSILITFERTKSLSLNSLWISALAAFFLALYFFLAKLVYLVQPFWSGFIWIILGGVPVGILFLFLKEVREEIFKKRKTFRVKTWGIFLSNQALGAGALILQNWAIALAGLVYLAMISALQGTQYVFLLLLAVFLSLKFPQILKEEISKEILAQKVIAILLIGGGLALLALK